MTKSIQLIFQIIQWIGTLFGLIGGIILIVRFFKERPILKIVFSSAHDINEDEEYTVFIISLDIDNIGDKSTTIKYIHFMMPNKEEKDSWLVEEFEDFKMFHLSPRSSMQFSEGITIDGFFEEDIEIIVDIDHTHGNIDEKTESTFISGLLSDEDDE